MGKCVMLVTIVTAAAVGALATGLSFYFVFPEIRGEQGEELEVTSAFCELKGRGVAGTLLLEAKGHRVLISGNITGLAKGKLGFHIHELGVRDGDCKSTLSHYNPHDLSHGAPNGTERHVGDLGNIESVEDGSGGTLAVVQITDRVVSLSPPYSVLGRSVVVHEGEDDLGASGHPSGAAGARVACCTIAVGA